MVVFVLKKDVLSFNYVCANSFYSVRSRLEQENVLKVTVYDVSKTEMEAS